MRVLAQDVDWHRKIATFHIPKGSPVQLAERNPGQRPGDNEYWVKPTKALKDLIGDFYYHDLVHYGCRVHESETEIINECSTSD